jgi:hypothetical protein
LDQYSSHASAFLNGLLVNIPSENLSQMNRFALNTVVHPITNASLEEQTVYAMVFNMIIMEGNIPEQKQIVEKMGDTFQTLMGRKQLYKAANYWKKRLSAFKDYRQKMHQLKDLFVRAVDQYPFFDDVSIHLYVDSGKNKGEFSNAMITIMDSIPWWQQPTTYCGMKHSLTDNSIREHSASGLTHDGRPSIFTLIKRMLYQDSYGSKSRWDLGWMTLQCGSLYTIISIKVPFKNFVISIISGLWIFIICLIVFIGLSLKFKKSPQAAVIQKQSSKNIDRRESKNSIGQTSKSVEQTDTINRTNELINDAYDQPKKFLFQTG